MKSLVSYKYDDLWFPKLSSLKNKHSTQLGTIVYIVAAGIIWNYLNLTVNGSKKSWEENWDLSHLPSVSLAWSNEWTPPRSMRTCSVVSHYLLLLLLLLQPLVQPVACCRLFTQQHDLSPRHWQGSLLLLFPLLPSFLSGKSERVSSWWQLDHWECEISLLQHLSSH